MKVLFDSGVYIKVWHDSEYYSRFETFAQDLRPQTYASSVVIGECWAGARDVQGQKLVKAVFKPFERAARRIDNNANRLLYLRSIGAVSS